MEHGWRSQIPPSWRYILKITQLYEQVRTGHGVNVMKQRFHKKQKLFFKSFCFLFYPLNMFLCLFPNKREVRRTCFYQGRSCMDFFLIFCCGVDYSTSVLRLSESVEPSRVQCNMMLNIIYQERSSLNAKRTLSPSPIQSASLMKAGNSTRPRELNLVRRNNTQPRSSLAPAASIWL